jgi:phosphate-selective porin OprO/OprP
MRSSRSGDDSGPSRPPLVHGLVLAAMVAATANAQGPPTSAPPAPDPSVPPAVATPVTASPPPSIDQMVEMMRTLEAQNRALAERLERSERRHEEEMRAVLERVDSMSRQVGVDSVEEGPAANGAATGEKKVAKLPPGTVVPPTEVVTPVPDYTEDQFSPDRAPPEYPYSNLLDNKRVPLRVTFGPGFELISRDEEFRLQVRLESQIEGRYWGTRKTLPAGSGISGMYLPRQRIFFDGNITKNIEYEFAINRGLGGLNLLNALLNFHLDDRLQFQIGRYFTPMLYDQYAISNYWMPTPERSLFTTNLSLNRQFGAKFWGYLFDQRLDYAVGAFNGGRNSFENTSGAMDLVTFLNARPFQASESFSRLKFLNLGGSVAYGHQDQPPSPVAFRLGAGSPDTNIPGQATVPFLVLDRGVIERGERLIGSAHAAYFHKGLSLLGEWQFGFAEYARPSDLASARVPFGGFYVSSGYFLTGEQVQRRSRLYPLRPLVPTSKDQKRGIGAWEVVGRFSELTLGDSVFTAGFADRAAWSNSASTTELGLNWYWNEYIKWYMFWLHGRYGDPVLGADGRYRDDVDMLWLRCQLYF